MACDSPPRSRIPATIRIARLRFCLNHARPFPKVAARITHGRARGRGGTGCRGSRCGIWESQRRFPSSSRRASLCEVKTAWRAHVRE